MADDEKCVQVGSFVWKWHESVGWYDADEDDPTFGNEGVLLDEIVRLRAEVERLTVESKEWDADTERHVARMAGLLHDIANALHGGPLPGGMWSWHDLPTIATAERALADQLAAALHESTPATDCWCPDMVTGRLCLACRSRAALALLEEARRG